MRRQATESESEADIKAQGSGWHWGFAAWRGSLSRANDSGGSRVQAQNAALQDSAPDHETHWLWLG